MNFKKVIASLSAVVIMCTASVFAASATETKTAYLTAKSSQDPVYAKLSNTLYTSSMSYGATNVSRSKADIDYLMTRDSTSGPTTYSCKFIRYYINAFGKSTSKTYTYSNRDVTTGYVTDKISTSKTTSVKLSLSINNTDYFIYDIAFASWD